MRRTQHSKCFQDLAKIHLTPATYNLWFGILTSPELPTLSFSRAANIKVSGNTWKPQWLRNKKKRKREAHFACCETQSYFANRWTAWDSTNFYPSDCRFPQTSQLVICCALTTTKPWKTNLSNITPNTPEMKMCQQVARSRFTFAGVSTLSSSTTNIIRELLHA